MKLSLLPYLCCPQCRSETLELSIENEQNGEIAAGLLTCRNCKADFEILNFIPCFLPKATAGQGWRSAWSYKWDNVARQMRYSEDGDEDFAIKMNYTGFFSGDLSGKVALDAGCGSGHDAARVAKAGAIVIGVDQSTGPYRALAYNLNKEHFSRIHLVRADIFNLPFRHGVFDIVYSNGALHHTPNTQIAFNAIAPLLKKGGHFAVWVYDRTQYWRLFETFWRPILCQIPRPALSFFLHMVNRPWYWIYRYRRFVMDKINPWPNSGVARFIFDVVSGGHFLYLLTDYHLHLAVTVDDHALRHHHAFDCYSPQYAWGHDEAELFDWCKENGLSPIAISKRRCGISAVK
jgi:SAM-dependent methyltransferase